MNDSSELWRQIHESFKWHQFREIDSDAQVAMDRVAMKRLGFSFLLAKRMSRVGRVGKGYDSRAFFTFRRHPNSNEVQSVLNHLINGHRIADPGASSMAIAENWSGSLD